MEPNRRLRRYDVDWLRVLAISAVFLYHCGRFFDESDWHVKNSQTSALVDTIKNLFDLWGMPLLFLISGASIYFALRPGRSVRFLTANSRLLAYANEAVLPVYVLHQPLILLIGFFVVPLALPILAKYLIITPMAIGITLGVYEFGVRRSNPVRRLFGLKPRRPFPPEAALSVQPSP